METLKKVVVSKRAELAARGGHPWIYGTEIEEAEEGIVPGDIVRAVSKKGKFIGSGFYNPHSRCAFFRRMPMTRSARHSGSAAPPTPWITGCR